MAVSAWWPTAVFSVPVVFVASALFPTAVLNVPDVTASNADVPDAKFPEPPKLTGTPIKMVGERFLAGFGKMYVDWFKEAPPKPKPKPKPKPAPVPEEKGPTAAEIAAQKEIDKDAINKLWMEYKRTDRTFRQRSVGATPAEKTEFKVAEDKVKALKAKYDAARSKYSESYKEDYDPTNE